MFHVMVSDGITYMAVAEEVGRGLGSWGGGGATRLHLPNAHAVQREQVLVCLYR